MEKKKGKIRFNLGKWINFKGAIKCRYCQRNIEVKIRREERRDSDKAGEGRSCYKILEIKTLEKKREREYQSDSCKIW